MNLRLSFILALVLLGALTFRQEARAQDAVRTPETAAASAGAEKSAEDKEREKRREKYRKAMKRLETTNSKPHIIAALAIVRKGWPECREALVESLSSRRARGRMFAVKLIGELGDAETDLDPLAKLLRDPSPTVRQASVMALQALGKSSRPHLESALPHEPEKNIRKMTVKSLQRIGSQESVTVLVRQLDAERDPGVRRFLVKALQVLTKKRIGDDVKAWEAVLRDRQDAIEKKRAGKYARELMQKRASEAHSDEQNREKQR